jgi:hypothetical protein
MTICPECPEFWHNTVVRDEMHIHVRGKIGKGALRGKSCSIAVLRSKKEKNPKSTRPSSWRAEALAKHPRRINPNIYTQTY